MALVRQVVNIIIIIIISSSTQHLAEFAVWYQIPDVTVF